MSRSATYLAPAKLNLALAVGPPELAKTGADGRVMHPICSWMVTVDLFDELQVMRLAEDRLSRYAILWHGEAKRRSEINWSVSQDLAVRAHQALERRAGRLLPVQVKLEKRIPVGGGLGGGSSDAAAMLVAVNEVHELGLSRVELATIGAAIGSDVPFLVHGGSAIVRGLGERIEAHAQVPEIHAVVAFPEQACPTGQVYAAFDRLRSAQAVLRETDVTALTRTDARGDLFNDLAAGAIEVAPALGEHIKAMSELAERPAHVSGSGSSVFVVCDHELHAEGLAGAVEAKLGLRAVKVRAVEGMRKA